MTLVIILAALIAVFGCLIFVITHPQKRRGREK